MLALPLPFLSFVVCSEKSSCAHFLLNAFTEVARCSSHRVRIQGFISSGNESTLEDDKLTTFACSNAIDSQIEPRENEKEAERAR
jgi:hypothetical protein